MTDEPRVGPGAVALVAAGVSSLAALCYPLARVASEGFPPIGLASSRLTIAALLLAALALLGGRPWPARRERRLLMLGAGPLLAAGYASMFLGAPRLNPGLATVLENTQPLFAAALGWVALREPVKARSGFALLLGFVGVIVITGDAQAPDGLGDGVAFVLTAALCVALANVVQRRVAEGVDPVTGAVVALGSAGAILLVAAAVGDAPTAADPGSARAIVALLVLAIVGTGLSQVGWLWVLKHMPLSRAAVFSFLPSVLGLILGAALYEDSFGPGSVFGASLVGAAALLVATPGRDGGAGEGQGRTGTPVAAQSKQRGGPHD